MTPVMPRHTVYTLALYVLVYIFFKVLNTRPTVGDGSASLYLFLINKDSE